ncbi:DUF3108 domain-containing protein, partial [Ideonella sp.]|uniref:DUF3108 domain-containing protein n=1 Tax=Ideonella sp. TaxID=1929293 RepID=UPI003BB52CC4
PTPPPPKPAASQPAAEEREAEGNGPAVVADASAEPVAQIEPPESAASAAAAPLDDAAPILAGGAPGIPLTSASMAAAASAPLAFDWPPSTRLRYTLTGQYRGPLHGSAQVEWLRQGNRYQVRLTVRVPPLFERRMVSHGTLGPDGLQPERYDQETDVMLRESRRETLLIRSDEIRLINGQTVPGQAGVQDTASQFVQMTWLFLTQPERLQAGRTVEFALALPRRVGRWRYTVQPAEPLQLPFGEVQVVPLKPEAGNARPNELQMALWVAPSLQYLPVRIDIRQDAETSLQLMLDEPPMQAAP